MSLVVHQRIRAGWRGIGSSRRRVGMLVWVHIRSLSYGVGGREESERGRRNRWSGEERGKGRKEKGERDIT